MKSHFWLVRREFSRDYFELLPEDAEVVRDVFRMYLNGASTQKIAIRLNQQASTRNKKWTAASVGRLLKDRAVLGERAKLKKADKRTVPGASPQVIAAEDFADVQALLEEERQSRGADPAVNFFRQRCFCECGQHAASERAGRSTWVLRCKVCKDARPIPMSYIEHYLFTSVMYDALQDLTKPRLLREPQPNLAQAQRDLVELAVTLETVDTSQLQPRLLAAVDQVIHARAERPSSDSDSTTVDVSSAENLSIAVLNGRQLTTEQREVMRRRLRQLDTKVVLMKSVPAPIVCEHPSWAVFQVSGGLLGLLTRHSRLGVGEYARGQEGVFVYVGLDDENVVMRTFRENASAKSQDASNFGESISQPLD